MAASLSRWHTRSAMDMMGKKCVSHVPISLWQWQPSISMYIRVLSSPQTPYKFHTRLADRCHLLQYAYEIAARRLATATIAGSSARATCVLSRRPSSTAGVSAQWNSCGSAAPRCQRRRSSRPVSTHPPPDSTSSSCRWAPTDLVRSTLYVESWRDVPISPW